MSYSGRGGHGYGPNKRGGGYGGDQKKKRTINPIKLAKESFAKRSERAQQQDLARNAELAPNIDVYLRQPNDYDFPFIDLPKDQQQMIESLCLIASKKPCEVVVKDRALKRSKKLRVVAKKDVKAEVEKEIKKAELAWAEYDSSTAAPQQTKRQLPTQAEILQEAQLMWLKDNNQPVHEGFFEGVSGPEKKELSEDGYLQRAKLALMTKSDTKGERGVMDYVERIRNDLQKVGFDVVPISGFDVSDLRF